MLKMSREEIESYAEKESIEFRHDESNLSNKYLRNEIRLKIMPNLEKINPRTKHNLANMADRIRLDEDYLNNIANRFITDKASIEEEEISFPDLILLNYMIL
jgi:tRNA(Ile)-lysidine synthase